MTETVSYCRLRMRPIQLYLLCFWKPRSDPINHLIALKPTLNQHLVWWLTPSSYTQGVCYIDRTPHVTLVTDASGHGWGAHCADQSVSGVWEPADRGLHINMLELKAVFLGMKSLLGSCRNQLILVKTDNSTVVSYINRQGGTHSPSLCFLTWKLYMWLLDRNLSVRAVHLAGKANTLADALSRGKCIPTEWSLRPQTVRDIFSLLGTPMIDLFASNLNHQLPVYYSRSWDPMAAGHDALSLNWDGMFAYAFPPISLVLRVLQKMRSHRCRLILIAPLWQRQVWFPALMELLYDLPIRLPDREDLLRQPKNRVLHPGVKSLHLVAWPISGNLTERKGFRQQWLTLPSVPSENPHSCHTMPDWLPLSAGAGKEILIPLRHLSR